MHLQQQWLIIRNNVLFYIKNNRNLRAYLTYNVASFELQVYSNPKPETCNLYCKYGINVKTILSEKEN